MAVSTPFIASSGPPCNKLVLPIEASLESRSQLQAILPMTPKLQKFQRTSIYKRGGFYIFCFLLPYLG